MGEPAVPTSAERAEVRELATAIVESVRNDEHMELGIQSQGRVPLYRSAGGNFYLEEDVKQVAAKLALEIVMLRRQLRFIALAAQTALQSVVPDAAERRLVGDIQMAASHDEVPDWFDDIEKENAGG